MERPEEPSLKRVCGEWQIDGTAGQASESSSLPSPKKYTDSTSVIRRSSRLHAKAVAKTGFEDGETTIAKEQVGGGYKQTCDVKRKGKARVSSGKKVSARPRTRRVRMKGSLEFLRRMPVDVFYEVRFSPIIFSPPLAHLESDRVACCS